MEKSGPVFRNILLKLEQIQIKTAQMRSIFKPVTLKKQMENSPTAAKFRIQSNKFLQKLVAKYGFFWNYMQYIGLQVREIIESIPTALPAKHLSRNFHTKS